VSHAAGDRLVIAPRLRRRTLRAAVRSATSRLDLSLFRCDDRVVLRALAAAADRGVRVRVLMTPHARAAWRSLDALQRWLVEHGVEVRRYAGGMKYHAKYLVADEREALVTTANITKRCFTRTCDFAFITQDAAVVSGLSALFAADWAGQPVALTPAQQERLIVGPDGRPRERFAALMCSARRCIRLVDAKLTDHRLARLLDERRHAGVAVDTARRRDVRPLRRHGKLLLLDDDAAVIGSFALSPAALERRRELAVVIRDPRLVAELDTFWRTHVTGRPEGLQPRDRTGRP
jgi:cardiolipin synthase A/B